MVDPVPGQPVDRDTPETGKADPAKAPVIVGLDSAAGYLNMSPDAFTQARKRDPIPGETREGRRPAWNVIDLREWHSQRPIAGKRVIPPTVVKDASGE
jgi:hypothetical protein